MDDPRRGRLRPRRALLSVLVVGAAVVLGLSPAGRAMVGPTDAAWHTGQPVTGAFAAAVIPAPRLTEPCHYDHGLGGEVVIHWAAEPGFGLADAQLQVSTSGLGSPLKPLENFNLAANTKFNPHSGHYTTTVRTTLLGSLLMLGSEREIAILMTRHGWSSKSASIATNAGVVGITGGTCRHLT